MKKLSIGDELIAVDASQNSTRNTVRTAIVEKIGRKYVHLFLKPNTSIQVDVHATFPIYVDYPYQYLIFQSEQKYQEYKEYKANLKKFEDYIRYGAGKITPEQIKKINNILGI